MFRLRPTLSLKVLSWNLHAPPFAWGKGGRLDRAASRIQEEAPDFVLLQELWEHEDSRRIAERLGSLYTAVDVAGHGFFFRRSGLLTFIRNGRKWRLRGSSFHRFEAVGSAWWKPWEGDTYGGKGYQSIDLGYEESTIVLINTHLQAEYGLGDRSRYLDVRARQLEELRNFAESIPADLPIIAAGDLNTRPEEPPYARFVEFWEDLGKNHREACGCGTHLLEDGREGGWIDYILARRADGWQIDVRTFETIPSSKIDDPYSDHHAVLASLSIAPRPGAALGLLALTPVVVNARWSRRQCLKALALVPHGW
jgi:endonuclease/exonuclease/phosphatase family metal-dependent hydrolase